MEKRRLRQRIYYQVVERYPYLSSRYTEFKLNLCEDGLKSKLINYFKLLQLHFKRIFFHEGSYKLKKTYENLPYLKGCESSLFTGKTPAELADMLCTYDVISFDIFDTLLFRPFASPVDLFHLVGEKLGYLNYAVLRHDMESIERSEHKKKYGNAEITLKQIYERLNRHCGIPVELGMKTELETEADLLFPNPYMQKVFNILTQRNKKIILISDMYLPKNFIIKVLNSTGYSKIENIFLSCEQGCNKHEGKLYEVARQATGENLSYVHIGDNAKADFIAARKAGFKGIYYQNVNLAGVAYRTIHQSRITGSTYAGTVNAHLHNGLNQYSPFYEYGFIYGGIFVLGYCAYIYDYVRKNNLDCVLFLARDGDILKQVYDILYPNNNSKYVYWSRLAAEKLGADYFRFDYLSKFLFHKVTLKFTVGEVLKVMEIEPVIPQILKQSGLNIADKFDEEACEILEKAVLDNWSSILQCYEDEHIGAKRYFSKVIGNVKKICTVDVGWAGSCGAILTHLIENEWTLGCKVTNILAGTNTPWNSEPDTTEAMLKSEKVISYMYSMSHNREIWSEHNPVNGHNLFFEALLASNSLSFKGFASDDSADGYMLKFSDKKPDEKQALDIQAGILDFVKIYSNHFEKYPYMLNNISGSDAYAPFAAACGQNNAYFKQLFKDSFFEVGVADGIRGLNKVVG